MANGGFHWFSRRNQTMTVPTPKTGQSPIAGKPGIIPGTLADLTAEASISISLAGRHVRTGRFAAARRQLTHSLRLVASLEAVGGAA
jgi:hypothetical protein